ncbi:MAG: GtrA family protein [Clostridia bacterium]|nr:GtrA family protein [Clostridia bacterium]
MTENLKNDNSNKKINKKEVIQALKFILCSIGAAGIQFGSFAIFNLFLPEEKYYYLCYIPSLILSILFNFTLNRNFTFKASNNIPLAMTKVFIFYLVFTPLSALWGQGLAMAGWNEFVILIFTMLINFVTEFIYQRFYVFHPKYNQPTQTQQIEENLENPNDKSNNENKQEN